MLLDRLQDLLLLTLCFVLFSWILVILFYIYTGHKFISSVSKSRTPKKPLSPGGDAQGAKSERKWGMISSSNNAILQYNR